MGKSTPASKFKPPFVGQERCSSCTGRPVLDAAGKIQFCDECQRRADANADAYDIGLGGSPKRSADVLDDV